MTQPNMDAINAAIKDVRRGMGTQAAATKNGLARHILRYWLQKKDAQRARFIRALQEEKEIHGKT